MSMTFEEYCEAIDRISEQLDDIARRTESQAWAGTADTSNPAFVALMQRYAKLTRRASELTERMVAKMG